MTQEIQEFIEKHIDLIENNKWFEFFMFAPGGTGTYLYAADIDFISAMKAVPNRCFADSNISSMLIPFGVTCIQDGAFVQCENLTSITIPKSVIEIGEYAFEGCSSLTNIILPDGMTSINHSAFCYCTSLTRINIPDSVKYINGFAFCDCRSLTNITIPNIVKLIDTHAFAGCSSLKTVTFTGTTEQWMKIYQGRNSFRDVPVREVICSNGITKLRI